MSFPTTRPTRCILLPSRPLYTTSHSVLGPLRASFYPIRFVCFPMSFWVFLRDFCRSVQIARVYTWHQIVVVSDLSFDCYDPLPCKIFPNRRFVLCIVGQSIVCVVNGIGNRGGESRLARALVAWAISLQEPSVWQLWRKNSWRAPPFIRLPQSSGHPTSTKTCLRTKTIMPSIQNSKSPQKEGRLLIGV